MRKLTFKLDEDGERPVRARNEVPQPSSTPFGAIAPGQSARASVHAIRNLNLVNIPGIVRDIKNNQLKMTLLTFQRPGAGARNARQRSNTANAPTQSDGVAVQQQQQLKRRFINQITQHHTPEQIQQVVRAFRIANDMKKIPFERGKILVKEFWSSKYQQGVLERSGLTKNTTTLEKQSKKWSTTHDVRFDLSKKLEKDTRMLDIGYDDEKRLYDEYLRKMQQFRTPLTNASPQGGNNSAEDSDTADQEEAKAKKNGIQKIPAFIKILIEKEKNSTNVHRSKTLDAYGRVLGFIEEKYEKPIGDVEDHIERVVRRRLVGSARYQLRHTRSNVDLNSHVDTQRQMNQKHHDRKYHKEFTKRADQIAEKNELAQELLRTTEGNLPASPVPPKGLQRSQTVVLSEQQAGGVVRRAARSKSAIGLSRESAAITSRASTTRPTTTMTGRADVAVPITATVTTLALSRRTSDQVLGGDAKAPGDSDQFMQKINTLLTHIDATHKQNEILMNVIRLAKAKKDVREAETRAQREREILREVREFAKENTRRQKARFEIPVRKKPQSRVDRFDSDLED